MDVLSIHFWPTENRKDNFLGKGYVTSGGLKSEFTVWYQPKFSQGFVVSLFREKDHKGEWKDKVSFVDRSWQDKCHELVFEKLKTVNLVEGGKVPALGGGSSTVSTSAPAQAAPAREATAISASTATATATGRLPF